MKKGITPIVAIVILLLIAVAIAGAAYTYITGYWTGLTGKALEITSTTCDSRGNVTINVRNFGQDIVSLADPPTGDVTVTRAIIAGSGGTLNVVKSGTIDPGQGGTITDAGAGTGCTDTSATCQYTITTAGRAQTVTVTCT